MRLVESDDPEKAKTMARDTLGKLIQIRNRLAANGRIPVRKAVPLDDKFINDKLDIWARTEGRDAKRKILIEIMRYVTDYDKPPRKPTRRRRLRANMMEADDLYAD